jgi:hypothetical protein
MPHVFTGTLAFNLLLGRRWPPSPDDLMQAEALCRSLGLGALLDRMPAGLLQIVGETGWQLPQGERSQLSIARTLLQGADCLSLDESFAASILRPCTRCCSVRWSAPRCCASSPIREALLVWRGHRSTPPSVMDRT